MYFQIKIRVCAAEAENILKTFFISIVFFVSASVCLWFFLIAPLYYACNMIELVELT